MSSCGNPVADPEALMPRKSKLDKSRMCVRCKETPGNIVIRHAVYCKDCFAPLVQIKFRRSFEPHVNRKPDGPRKLALKPSGDLLVGFSGGLGSTVLLDLVHRTYLDESAMKTETGGKAHPRKGKVWKNIHVCYVEICDAFPGIRDRTEEVRQAVNRYEGFEFVPLRIQDAFDAKWWKRVSGDTLSGDLDVDLTSEDLYMSPSSSTSSPLSSLQACLQSLPTPTAVASSISTLTRLLLLYTAHSTGSSHLILGTSLTSLSIALISSISQGGGFTVPQEAQEEWTPFGSEPASGEEPWAGDVRVIRPLREIGMKECAAWAWWNHLPVVGKEKLPGMRQTIGGLTKDFIVGLEKDFPSTVSTIARTVGKLAPKEDAGGRCIFCERAAQSTVQEWKSRISIRSLSESSHSADDDKERRLTPLLCYFCHTTLTSRSSRSAASTKPAAPVVNPKVPLPVWVSWHFTHNVNQALAENGHAENSKVAAEDNEVWQRKPLGQDAMKAAVSEFLLEE
ncbi:hypothetical protein EVG20_g1846 [Dentipellis fragilis]|uniref:Cytoplasmic tRNA 2-thiolation protein 2 n=1 Tax=Dentipellis fragilis TaxID=205917 RepID=A0A4Y9ZAZ3_9AGAM|nr:hypothetical protein EVG20_g1846 [Dentipellis fragilis]